MKATLVLFVLLMAGFSFAEEKGQPDFEQRKKAMLEEIDQRISALQSDKACVSAAKAPEDMKKCHEKRMARDQEMRSKHAQHRKEMIDEQIKRLQQEKERIGTEK